MELYPIKDIPASPEPVPLNLERLRATMSKMDVGQGFVIPVADLKDDAGVFRSTPLGKRVHRVADELGIRVSTKKIEEGLRVRREE